MAMRVLFSVLKVGTLTMMLALAGCASSPQTDMIKAQSLVEESQLTFKRFAASDQAPFRYFQSLAKDAVAFMIFPETYKAGFFAGIEGGSGILIARENGQWGYPAFYTLASGSFGIQMGAQASELILVIRSQRALDAIILHQGKIGADLDITVGTGGAGVDVGTTANAGKDIMTFSTAAGLYGGLSLEGAALIRRADLNNAYYGAEATPREIVIQNKHTNPHADALRHALDGG